MAGLLLVLFIFGVVFIVVETAMSIDVHSVDAVVSAFAMYLAQLSSLAMLVHNPWLLFLVSRQVRAYARLSLMGTPVPQNLRLT